MRLYQSNSSIASGYSTLNLEDKSYILTVFKGSEVIDKIEHLRADEEPINIDVYITKLKHSGNYFFPLYKNYTVDFEYEYQHSWGKGSAGGSINRQITGLSSIRYVKHTSMQIVLNEISKIVGK